MEAGHLGFPKLEIGDVPSLHSFQTRLYIQYAKLISTTAIGKNISFEIKNDPRVRALDGCMLFRGLTTIPFDPITLSIWHLWATNEYGKETADKNLNAFLDATDITVINTLWILGIEVDECISLPENMTLVPTSEMPDSNEKERYLKHHFGFDAFKLPQPSAAITIETSVTKSYKSESVPPRNRQKEYLALSALLRDASLALNAISNISCIPYFSTSYVPYNIPIGPFGGSGGSMPMHDVVGSKKTKVTAYQVDEINTVINSFLILPKNEKARFTRILSRLSQAKRREDIEDKILDLGIALEMALLDENKSGNQLSLTFRLRGSWFIAADENERLQIYQQLGDIYNYRSQVAHSGSLGNKAKQISEVRDKFPDYSLLAERIISKLLREGKPDWSRLILGVVSSTPVCAGSDDSDQLGRGQ